MRAFALVISLVGMLAVHASEDFEQGALFEGDIDTNYNQVLAIYGKEVADAGVTAGFYPAIPPEQRGAVSTTANLWPGGVMYYDFDGTLSAGEEDKVRR